jgi:3-phenylpropionate/trans-cinnamate dioxygenase ferredoxin subunit
MGDYTDVLGVDELADGAMTDVEVGDDKVLLARVGETFFSSQGRCPHMHGHLAKGKLDGTVVTCPRHGSQFDLTDGHVVRWTDWQGVVEEVGEVLRHPRPLRMYDVRVENGRVLIGPEKPSPASE